MLGWLIYDREEAKRNQGAVQLFEHAGRDCGLQIQLKYTEDISREDNLPDFVINRSRDWNLGKWFENQRIRVFNSSEITKIGNDKYEAYRVMDELQVPVLPFELRARKDKAEIPPFPFVLKSCSGHGGSEVFLIQSLEQYEEAMKQIKEKPFVIQQVASDIGKDVRLFIIDNQVKAAMLRTSTEDFRSNYSLGGQVEVWQPDTKSKGIAEQIAQKIFAQFHIDYAGIDLIFHEGKPVFNELEDMVGARMLYQHTDMDIIRDFVAYIQCEMTEFREIS